MYIRKLLLLSTLIGEPVEIVPPGRNDWRGKGAGRVCSACAGDDPRPEMFASFVVCSPEMGPMFAIAGGKRRSVYRTQRFWRNFTKGALMLAISRMRERAIFSARARVPAGIGTVYLKVREKFHTGSRARVWNTRNGSATGSELRTNCRTGGELRNASERTMQLNGEAFAGKPIDIRVTQDAIIEVYGAVGPPAPRRDGVTAFQNSYAAIWNESYASREAARWSMARYRRSRMARFVAAYIAFAAIAALVIWCVVR